CLPSGLRAAWTAGIGAVTAPGGGVGAATGPDASAGPTSSQNGVKLSASRSASSILSGADEGRPLSGGSGINCGSEASIAARGGATRGSRWLGRFAEDTLRAGRGGMPSPSFLRDRLSLTLLG